MRVIDRPRDSVERVAAWTPQLQTLECHLNDSGPQMLWYPFEQAIGPFPIAKLQQGGLALHFNAKGLSHLAERNTNV